MPTPVKWVQPSPGVWKVDDDGDAESAALAVVDGSDLLLDSAVSTGLGTFIDDDDVTLYIDTEVTVPEEAGGAGQYSRAFTALAVAARRASRRR